MNEHCTYGVYAEFGATVKRKPPQPVTPMFPAGDDLPLFSNVPTPVTPPPAAPVVPVTPPTVSDTALPLLTAIATAPTVPTVPVPAREEGRSLG